MLGSRRCAAAPACTSLLKMIVSLGVLNKKQIKYRKMATTKIASGTKTKSLPKGELMQEEYYEWKMNWKAE